MSLNEVGEIFEFCLWEFDEKLYRSIKTRMHSHPRIRAKRACLLGVFHHLGKGCEKPSRQFFGGALDQPTAQLGNLSADLCLGHIFQTRGIAYAIDK